MFNIKTLYVSFIALSLSSFAMEIEEEPTQTHTKKRKRDETLSEQQEKKLLEDLEPTYITAFTKITNDTIAAYKLCQQFWHESEQLPPEQIEKLLSTILTQWESVEVPWPRSKKFKIYSILCNTASKLVKPSVAKIIGEQLNTENSFTLNPSCPHFIIPENLVDSPLSEDSLKLVLQNLDPATALTVANSIIELRSLSCLKQALRLGLDISTNPTTLDSSEELSPLINAIKILDIKKVKLVLKYNAYIPNNAIAYTLLVGVGQKQDERNIILTQLLAKQKLRLVVDSRYLDQPCYITCDYEDFYYPEHFSQAIVSFMDTDAESSTNIWISPQAETVLARAKFLTSNI